MRKISSFTASRIVLAIIAMSAWTVAGGALAAPAQVIELKGTTNTRDIGGYPAHDQRIVRSGQIIRSEKLSRLTAEDFAKLEDLGVKTVIDLRTEQEREDSPTVWHGEKPPVFHHFPIGDADSGWYAAQSRLMARNRFTEKQSLEHMADGYRMIAEEGVESYRALMELVLDESNWPILIHCSAGKDRTGIATALILEAVGVDRAVIMDEYLLTNEIGRSAEKAELMERESAKASSRRRGASAEAWYPIVGVRAEMLEAFYVQVDERYGSVDAFLAEIGVDDEARNGLVGSLTTDSAVVAMGE